MLKVHSVLSKIDERESFYDVDCCTYRNSLEFKCILSGVNALYQQSNAILGELLSKFTSSEKLYDVILCVAHLKIYLFSNKVMT